MHGESSDMFWNVDIGDLEPTPLEVSPLEEGLTTNLEGTAGGDFDMPVEDFFDLDPFPLDGMPLDGDDWVSTLTEREIY